MYSAVEGVIQQSLWLHRCQAHCISNSMPDLLCMLPVSHAQLLQIDTILHKIAARCSHFYIWAPQGKCSNLSKQSCAVTDDCSTAAVSYRAVNLHPDMLTDVSAVLQHLQLQQHLLISAWTSLNFGNSLQWTTLSCSAFNALRCRHQNGNRTNAFF